MKDWERKNEGMGKWEMKDWENKKERIGKERNEGLWKQEI